MLMVTTFLPLVYTNLPPIIRSHHIWTFMWVFSMLIYYPKIFFNKRMIYLYSYGLFLIIAKIIIWSDLNIWYIKNLFYELYIFAIGISVVTYFLQTKDYISLAKIAKWSIVFMFITSVMTMVSTVIDPMYARHLVALSEVTLESEREVLLSVRRYGGGTYSSAGAFMCLFPIFIYYYKNIKISLLSKKMLIVLSGVFFFALLGMQIFANILIALVFIVLAMFGMKKIKQFIWVIGLFLSIMVITPNEVYVNSTLSISSFFKRDSEFNAKLKDLSIFIETSDINDRSTGTGGRAARYPLLLGSFVKSPLFGAFYKPEEMKVINNGGGFHLYWMYKLATTGVIVFLVFLYIPYIFIKNNLRYFNPTYKLYYILASLAILSYGLTKVIGGRETWYAFFVILPGLYFLPLLKKNHRV